MKKEFYSEHTLLLTNCGREDCSDLHSWGPGIRPCYIIHYVIKGAGWLEYGKKRFYIQAGQSFLLYPYTVLRYYPDPEQPWEYTWVDFMGENAPELLSNTGFSPACPVSPAISPQQILPLYERLCSLDILYHNKGEACGLLMALLGLYADSFPGSSALNSHREDNRLSTAILLIQTHCHKPEFNVEALCESMHINRVTLYRLFREACTSLPTPISPATAWNRPAVFWKWDFPSKIRPFPAVIPILSIFPGPSKPVTEPLPLPSSEKIMEHICRKTFQKPSQSI